MPVTYKILWAEKSTAMDRPGLAYDSYMDAEDYVKKANEESPRFHYWAEPMVAPQEKLSAVQRQMLSRRADVSEK